MLQRTVAAPVTAPELGPAGPPAGAPARLADRLDDLRRRCFVGREVELEAFRAALSGVGRPCALLYVYGPGGVGKSVLLREFARAACSSDGPGGAVVVALDGREMAPSPAGFLGALRLALGQPPGRPDAPAGIEDLVWPRRPLLLIDTYEALAPLDPWLRDVLLPRLPQGALVVLAGRTAPPAAWRADPAWSELGRYLPLRNLPPRESRAYLRARGVPPAQHAAVLDRSWWRPPWGRGPSCGRASPWRACWPARAGWRASAGARARRAARQGAGAPHHRRRRPALTRRPGSSAPRPTRRRRP